MVASVRKTPYIRLMFLIGFAFLVKEQMMLVAVMMSLMIMMLMLNLNLMLMLNLNLMLMLMLMDTCCWSRCW